MGIYLNPGNSGFAEKIRTEYVDKTGLIRLINSTINTNEKLTCISRPRRFGKSYAAQMLCAYYDKSCDSEELFSNFSISGDESYREHLNKYDVLYLDISGILGEVSSDRIVQFIRRNITVEIESQYPGVKIEESFAATLVNLVDHTGNKVVMIIDEWDSPVRESGDNPEAEKRYFEFLRSLFKNSGTTSKIFAAVYMTGILPIKKDRTGSAVSDFMERSILDPRDFAGYYGFTEDEVKGLCGKNGRSFESMKKWYDGYTIGERDSIYNPYSVMEAVRSGKYRSYWKKTSAAETLMTYIDLDFEGLQGEVARLVAGEEIPVSTESFENDINTFKGKDDVITLLIHLGYLTFREVPASYNADDEETIKLARIPNEEVRFEFESILRKSSHRALISLINKSDILLNDTIAGLEERVAKAVQEVHDSEYALTFYNDEQSLRYVIKLAYISCVDKYAKVEELPSGHGIADVVFIPKRNSALPAMVVELKWNHSSEAAIMQIKDRNYLSVLKNYGGEILSVGISYDEKTKVHSCRIERVRFGKQ